jgi:very-short-patch-repair endonuclease
LRSIAAHAEDGRVASPRLTRARALRTNATDAERTLWRHLRARALDGHKFVRQVPIDRYVVDFICREARLIIELDGGQHAGSAYDAARDAALGRLGYRVVRYWNADVLRNLEGVLTDLKRQLSAC